MTMNPVHVGKKFKFEPPLYIQRYSYVIDLLRENKCKSLLDIGCAEGKLINLVRNSIDQFNLIVGLDCDQLALERAEQNLTRSFLDMITRRQDPLDIYLVRGHIDRPSDYFVRQMNYDASGLDCVTLVEVIEHMDTACLSECVRTVFEKLRPNLVIVSTPNSEFNVVFDQLDGLHDNHTAESSDHVGPEHETITHKFRHWDHKFEWTRDEFKQWCNNSILAAYGHDYELVRLDGLGTSPFESGEFSTSQLGHCTQIALFKRHAHLQLSRSAVNNDLMAYIDALKKINYLNNRLDINNRLVIDPYLHDKFFKIEQESYEIKLSIRYPFKSYSFESSLERDRALMTELNYFIGSYVNEQPIDDNENENDNDNDDYFDMRYHNEDDLNEEEEIELNANGLDHNHVKLISVAKFFAFCNMQSSFGIDENEFFSIVNRMTSLKLTLSQKYIICPKKRTRIE